MHPCLFNGKFQVSLHKPEVALLQRARDLGRLLVECRQPVEGQKLIDVATEILCKFGDEEATTEDVG